MPSKAARILKGIEDAYPDLCREERERMAEQLVHLIDNSIDQGYNLTKATLQAKGATRTPLGTRLQQLREAAGLTQQYVTRDSEWHVSKVTRIETGRVPVTITDLRYLLRLYGIRDPQIISNLTALARQDHADRIAQRRRAS